MDGRVEPAAGALEAVVQGGALLSVVALRHHGRELLVDPAALPAHYLVHGARAGITLLHPFANRVGADRFTTAGAEVVLDGAPVMRDPGGVALHGLALPGTWAPALADPATVRATASFPPMPAFPWAHAVEVRIALTAPARVTVDTTVRATGDAAVPVAFGWHPYFALDGAARDAWRLALPPREHLGLDPAGLPDGTARGEPAEEAPLGGRMFDDGYAGLADGAVAALSDGVRRVEVTLVSGYPAAQVFAPGDRDVVSLEPMTAPTDALRTGRGLRLARELTARFTIDVRG